MLYDASLRYDNLLKTSSVKGLAAPNLQTLLDVEVDKPFTYEKSFVAAKDDPCVVLHTSGTTSLPKPIILTHGQLATFDAQWRIPPLQSASGPRETFVQAMTSCRRFLIALPFFHMAGFSMGLFLPLHPHATVVLTDPSRQLSTSSVEECLKKTQANGAIIPPSILQEMTESWQSLELFRMMRYVFYGGAPLRPEAGLPISQRTHLCNQIGSTECVVLTTHMTDTDDWEYFCFGSEWNKYEFNPTAIPDMFEMVIHKKDNAEDYQAVFQGSGLSQFSTGDMYSKHPYKAAHWKYEGRLDDVIVMSNGEKFNPVTAESLISTHPLLKSCAIAGNRRPHPCVVLELEERPSSNLTREQVLVEIWPVIKKANTILPGHAQIDPAYIILADPEKPFMRTSKGTLQRLRTMQLYEKEVYDCYAAVEGFDQTNATEVNVEDPTSLSDFILSVYRETTGSCSLRADEDIFKAGADSIKVQRASSKMKASIPSLAGRINAKMIYSYPTAQLMVNSLVHHKCSSDVAAEHREYLEDVCDRYRQQLSPTDPASAELPYKTVSVILTGSTGSLGTYLLDSLMRSTEVCSIICLNRSGDASTRQAQTNYERGLNTDFKRESVHFLQADLSQPKLGLDSASYDHLISNVSLIIHNQWPVDFNLPLPYFEPHLVGVVNLINFATRAAYKPSIFFISSVASVNNWRRHVSLPQPFTRIPEKHLSDLTLSNGGYGESKAIASELLLEAKSTHGLRVGIARLGQVAGPITRESGIWNKKEWLPSLLRSSFTLNTIPKTIPLLDEIDWVPVDIAADSLCELALDSNGAIYRHGSGLSLLNVANPRTISWEDLLPTIQNHFGLELDAVPFDDWLALLESRAVEEVDQVGELLPAIKLLDFFNDLRDGGNRGAKQTLLETDATENASPSLSHLGAIDGEMMSRWLKQWKFEEATPVLL